jgi:hypothetical protein
VNVEVIRLWAQKGGERPESYEDASEWGCVGSSVDGAGPRLLRAALSDGASASTMAKDWAELLVHCCIRADPSAPVEVVAGLAAGRASGVWPRIIREYVRQRNREGRPIAWNEEPGLERGAFATLLAVDFFADSPRPGTGSWQAAAVGDTCIFQVRDDALIAAFPISDPDLFGLHPSLLGSRSVDVEPLQTEVKLEVGYWQTTDQLYLCTDAMAAWFLRRGLAGLRPWLELDGDPGAQAGFADWVTEQRRSGDLRNDDTTVIRVSFAGCGR